MNGIDLLVEFRKTRSDAAFSELVRRYTNLVYSVAKRRLGDPTLAEEVTQLAFVRLATAAPNLPGDAELIAWLHRTTVHLAIDMWRSESRRRAREERSVSMQDNSQNDATWTEVSILIDSELNQLSDPDRKAILLRFFDHQSMRDVGAAFGISEDAAKMRVSRALDRLRDRLVARGLTCTTAALGLMVWENSVQAAPVALATSLACFKASSIPVAAAKGVALKLSTAKIVAVALSILLIGGSVVFKQGRQKRHESVSTTPASSTPTNIDPALVSNVQPATSDMVRAPDPGQFLKQVIKARQSISSGTINMQAQTVFPRSGFMNTNRYSLTISFDGPKRRFISQQREYGIPAEDQTQEMVDARLRELRGDREAAVSEGILIGQNAHYVTIYDGEALLQYRIKAESPKGHTAIKDPNQGSAEFLFDPRCLGLGRLLVSETPENFVQIENAKSITLLGQEILEGIPAWHVRVESASSWGTEVWIDAARPERVIQWVNNGDIIRSKFNSQNDVLPSEVTIQTLRQGAVVFETRLVRSTSRFNIQFDPATWTLAGLEMPIGTEVSDWRRSRMIGYWDGHGISETLASATAATNQDAPNLSEKLALLETSPATEQALQAAIWVMLNSPDGTNVTRAAEVIQTYHLFSPDLGALCKELERVRPQSAQPLLEAILDNNLDPEIKAKACYSLASIAADKGDYGKNQRATAEAISYLERIAKDFSSISGIDTFKKQWAQQELYRLRYTSIGKIAPEIAGHDLDGNPMKLSDFRGKTTVLVFWMRSESDQKDFAKLQSSDSVSVLGVYVGSKLADAKDLVERTGTTWPSFYDPDRNICDAWVSSFPQIAVIDSNGVIRNRKLCSSSEVISALNALSK